MAETHSVEAEVVIGSRRQLLHLLLEASEIDHTLMCSYLDAAFRLEAYGDERVSADDAKHLADWREAIKNVAIDGRDKQEGLMAAAFGSMHIFGTAAGALARLPANAKTPGVNAGMSFTMLRGVEPVSFGDVESAVLAEQLTGLATGAPASPGNLKAAAAKLPGEFSFGSAR